MSDHRISEDFIIGHASLVNEIEDQRELYNDQLKTVWSDYREELKTLGLKGKEIAAEVAALKSAIADTRLTAEDRAKAEEKSDGKDDYLAILNSPRARARIREGKSNTQPTKAAGQAVTPVVTDQCAETNAGPSSSVENEAAEISTPIQPETENETADIAQPISATRRVDDLGSVQDARKMSTDGQPAEGLGNSDMSGRPGEEKAGATGGESAATKISTFTPKLLRPHCLKPEMCGGQGKQHCYSCSKAMNQAGAA
jgi:hypothetical protein